MNSLIDDSAYALQAVSQGDRTIATSGRGQWRSPSFSKLLEGPVWDIAGNVPERADATSAAILGYN